jgi:hypothetical protein
MFVSRDGSFGIRRRLAKWCSLPRVHTLGSHGGYLRGETLGVTERNDTGNDILLHVRGSLLDCDGMAVRTQSSGHDGCRNRWHRFWSVVDGAGSLFFPSIRRVFASNWQ